MLPAKRARQHGSETLAHVAFDMSGEQVQQDVAAHPWREPVVDRF